MRKFLQKQQQQQQQRQLQQRIHTEARDENIVDHHRQFSDLIRKNLHDPVVDIRYKNFQNVPNHCFCVFFSLIA
jgi:hypothetical protein